MKKKGRTIKMQTRVTQKYTTKYIVAASSLLSLIIGGVIYLNFSQNTESLANEKQQLFTPNLRTTNIDVPSRILRSGEASLRLNHSLVEKNKNRVLISRSKDEIVIATVNSGGEQ